MAGDDKKTSAGPKNVAAEKKEVAAEKTRASRRTRTQQMLTDLRLRAAGKLPARPRLTIGARAKNRFRKHTEITGTRFTRRRKRRNGNCINGAGYRCI